MVASNMTVGVDLLTTPPLGLNRVLIYAARMSRLDTVWAVDHWQGPSPTAIWDQQFSWYATQYKNPHELFDYQVLLGYLAKSAGRLRMGVGVTDPIRRHPVLIAQAMLTLAHMTRRRPILGIGAGERENIEPYGLDFTASVSRLEEALQIIRLCFSHQGHINFRGKYYQLDRAVMDLRAPKGKTPEIWIGGQGPRMLQLTGQYGEGWYPTAIASQEEDAAKLQIIQNKAQEAGADPQGLTPSLAPKFGVAPPRPGAREMLDTRFGRLFALPVSSAAWRQVGAPHPSGEDFWGFLDWI